MITDKQKKIQYSILESNKYPTAGIPCDLTRKFGNTPEKITTWFNNARERR